MRTATKLLVGVLGGRGGGMAVPVITTSTIPDAGVGVAYSTTISATNTPTSWSVVVTDYDGTDITSGCGLSINSSGVLSGTPAIPAGSDGLWTVTVTASNAGGASTPVAYTIECWQLRVDFSTDDAAPISNPYAGEFGSLATTDSGSNVAVSSGVATISNITTAWTDPRLTYQVAKRDPLAIVMKSTMTGGQFITGFRDVESGGSGNIKHAYYMINSVAQVWPGNFATDGAGMATDIICVVTVSGLIYQKVGAGDYELCWNTTGLSLASTLFASTQAAVNPTVNHGIDYFRVIDLPAPLATLYGAASFNATSAFSDVRTGTANAEITGEYSIPSPDAASDELSIIFRRQDANNHWRARIVRNGGDTNYDLLVDTVASGSPTNRLTVSNIGNTDALRIRADGNTIRFFTRSGTTWTARSSVTLSLYSAETGVTSTVVQGSWTQTRIVSVPLTDATVTAILDRVTA